MSFSYFDVKSGCPFQPVQCSEATFLGLTPEDGHVYFTTDTKKIYLGKNSEAIQMCGATGFFYGTKEIEYDNSGNTPDPNVTFYFNEIEGDEIPQKDDLILNIDGCFYRVKSVEEDEISTTRLTLQGSGGGGGTGGGTGSTASFKIAAVGGSNKVFSSTASSAEIGFIANYSGDDASNYISLVECTMKDSDTPFYAEYDATRAFNIAHTIDLVDYLDNFSTSKKSFTLKVQDKYGEERSMTYSVQIVELYITATQDEMLYLVKDETNTEYNYDCQISGGKVLSNRKLTYTIYSEDNLFTPVLTYDYATTDEGNVQKSLNLASCAHGIYILKVQASGSISGGGNVQSNILTHKIVCFDSAVGDAIFAVLLPEKTEQFTNIPLSYLLVEGGTSNNYTMEIRLNGELETTLTINSNNASSYNLMFEDTGKYTLNMKVMELAKEFTALLDITSYTGKLPVINTNRDDLDLYLNPRGKTNEVVDKDVWASYNGKYSGYLNDFYYGDINGWFIDDDGASYLKLSQGANLSIPDYKPFATNAMDASRYGITVELDFKISSVLDYDADLIRCISTDRDGTIYAGFKVTGNQAFFYTSIKNGKTADPVTLNLVENKRIKISYVVEKNDVDFPMILAYLNGKVSSVSKYEKDDRLVDAGGDGSTPGTIFVDSSQAQIDIYGIRVYSSALAQSVVLNNYQASLGSLEEREKSYKNNLILDSNNKVDLRLIEDEDYEFTIPYIKITGGYSASDKKAMTMGTSGGEFALPIGKKDFRLINFELKYPKSGYFKEKGYEDFSEICTFESGNDVTNAFGETPITGCVMYAQGTSSLEYPVKNLRIKFKTKKIPVRPGMEPVDLVCLKADFMESSGSHNTGAANWIDTVYEMAGMKTPGQEYFENEDIVTCIKGHPVAVFWSPSGADGTYEYVGKYNFNLDKATPEPFGFKNVPEKYDASATEKFGWDENGKNTIRCFEYLDNSIRVCNFLPKEGKTYEETWYELITDETGKTHYGWTEGFESRHPEDLVGEHDGDDIYDMAKWVNELYTLGLTDRAKAVARFKAEYECYFNKEYLVGYYLITNILLMIDSRTKNCMMASWGRQEKTYHDVIQDDSGNWIEDESTSNPTNYFIWYPIFYDMDTMLGIDNQGYPRLRYYHEDTDPEIFNGNDVLWNFVRDALGGEIATYYDKFESAASMFTAPTILPYFNDNQANLANEALYNGDADYKYIDTFRKGYTNHLTGEVVEPGKGTRLYAAQGDRSLDREYFVNNRVNFLRAKYQSNNYQSGDRVEFRMYVPTGESGDTQEEIDKIKASIAVVPPNKVFDLTALGYGFAGVKFGQNGRVVNHQFRIGEPFTVSLTSDQDPADLESYILGLNNLADIGDLSNKYLKSFIIKSQNKLKRIILGNDYKDYFNPYWGKTGGADIDVQSCYLLEEINMINCDEYKGALNFTNCKQLKKVLLTGCGVTSLTLPEGTVIEEMRLPNTLQTLEIRNQTFLEADKFSLGYFDYNEDANKMFAEDGSLNGQYVNSYDNLRYIQILNTPIDTYDIVRRGKELQEYHFSNVNWVIDENDNQYCTTEDTELDSSKTYYQYSNGEYVEYEGTEFISGLYENIKLINDDGTITHIPVLEKLIRMSTKNNIDRQEALSGTLHINVSATVDQFELYYKYNRIYPNLNFTYGDLISGTKAYQIEFFRTDIDNMSSDVNADYVVMTNGSKTLAELTSADGPAGSALFTPVKASTNTLEFDFTGIWVDYLTNEEISVDSFETYKPARDMKLAPKFTSRTRYYTISFYNWDNSHISDLQLEYNANVGSQFAGLPQVWYMYRPATDLTGNQRYALKGWQTEASFNNPTTNFSLYNLDELNIVDNMSMWAYYEVEDASQVATDLRCFNIYETSYKLDTGTVSGLVIDVAAGYQDYLGGKITLPSTYNGTPIKFIGNFVGTNTSVGYSHKITDIYTLSDASFVAVTNGAFNMEYLMNNGGDTALENVYLPETITYIGDSAFSRCSNLKKCDLPDGVTYIGGNAFAVAPAGSFGVLEMDELPSSLTYIGPSAFFRGGYGVKFSYIPDGITTLSEFSLSGCPRLTINQFGGGNSKLTTIGSSAFRNSGSQTVTTLTFEAPLTSMESYQQFKFQLDEEGYAMGVTTINTHSLFGYDSADEWEEALFDWSGARTSADITTTVTS